jgi:hypothetical protein
MIHASKLFPIALDRIHDHLNRVNDSSDNPETKRKGERKAGDRGPIRVKRIAKRVGAKQMELPLTHK